MRFRIRHVTSYRYDRPVALGPHVFRMQPRSDDFLRLDAFRLSVYPLPVERRFFLDAEGNPVTSMTFAGNTQEFRVAVESAGETFACPIPRAAADIALSPDYGSVPGFLEAWLHVAPPEGSAVPDFARAVAEEAGERALDFLGALSARMHATLRDVSRLTGPPLDPETTLRSGKGSCRDFAVLFVACCRHQGIAARFVSGYLPAEPGARQHMHAWAEALLPGVGWLPFDPTRGGPAGPEHVSVAAAAEPADATPIAGTFAGAARSEMSVELTVDTGD